METEKESQRKETTTKIQTHTDRGKKNKKDTHTYI